MAAAGQSIWTVTLRWKGKACHELNRPPHADGLRLALARTIEVLHARAEQLARRPPSHPLLKPESLFIGQAHMGDFYNRTPLAATVQGTCRWHPGKTFPSVRREFNALLATIRLPSHLTLRTDWNFVGEAYQIAADKPVVRAYQDAYRTVTGTRSLPAGTMAVCDGARLVPLGHVPTVLCGFENGTAHADYEFVRLARLAAPCRIALLTALNYLEQT